MSQSQDRIERQALELSRSERARVALLLIDSLEQEEAPVSPDVIEQAWVKESVRRLQAYRRGEMDAYPAEDVIGELEKPEE